jgi:hypothetical protein
MCSARIKIIKRDVQSMCTTTMSKKAKHLKCVTFMAFSKARRREREKFLLPGAPLQLATAIKKQLKEFFALFSAPASLLISEISARCPSHENGSRSAAIACNCTHGAYTYCSHPSTTHCTHHNTHTHFHRAEPL